MGKEFLTIRTIVSQRDQVMPCNQCEVDIDLDTGKCRYEYPAHIPGKTTAVMCKKFGIVEPVNHSQFEGAQRNGEFAADNRVPGQVEAVL